MTVVDTTSTDEAEIHDVLASLNTMAQSLGVATFPYSHPSTGPLLNIKALKVLMDEAISLLESDAEEEPTPPKPYGGTYHTGASVFPSRYHNIPPVMASAGGIIPQYIIPQYIAPPISHTVASNNTTHVHPVGNPILDDDDTVIVVDDNTWGLGKLGRRKRTTYH